MQQQNSAKLNSATVRTSNHMFGRAIWAKLPERFFENFEIARLKTRATSKYSKIMRVIYHKNCLNQTCDYWLITSNQQTLSSEINIF